MIRLLFSAFLFLTTGCATAHLTSFRDPAYSTHEFNKIAVVAVGMYLDNALAVENQVCENVAPASCVLGKRLLPPIRTYSSSEIGDALTQAGVDGILVVVLGDDKAAS